MNGHSEMCTQSSYFKHLCTLYFPLELSIIDRNHAGSVHLGAVLCIHRPRSVMMRKQRSIQRHQSVSPADRLDAVRLETFSSVLDDVVLPL